MSSSTAIVCKDAEQASSRTGAVRKNAVQASNRADTAVKMQGKRATVKMAANMGRKAKI